jgi:cytoskeleton protein RodZ
MTEAAGTPDVDGALSAGAMLRAAREKQGVHIAVLAAAIKVSPRKLDALEHDRYEELPDATFVRALAQTVCRALKIDAQPVLARLPEIGTAGLDHGAGLNMPFRERPVHNEPGGSLWPQRPLLWAGALLLVAAIVIAVVPTGLWSGWTGGGEVAPSPAASAPTSAASAAGAAALPAAPDPAQDNPTAAAAASAAASSAPLVESIHAAPGDLAGPESGLPQISTSEESWIEAVDASGQVLLSRLVLPGETLRLQGALPIRLKVGNARGTQVVLRGQPVDLAPATRDNVARLELK